MSDLARKIVALHEAFAAAELPHAFGGALALAWCTGSARGTIDIDINVFVEHEGAEKVLAVFPEGVVVGAAEKRAILRDGQARFWWDKTPVDLFLNSTAFHRGVAERIQFQAFHGAQIPFLCCQDLAVFKAFFNRSRDWSDLEEMFAARTIDQEALSDTLAGMLGDDDERVLRLKTMRPV